MLPKMENKDLTAGEREAILILKNKNKTYAAVAKLLKISRISVYYTLKNFGPTSFSSHKNQSSRRRKTTKNVDDRIVIISKQNRHLTASDITLMINQSLPKPVHVSTVKRRLNKVDHTLYWNFTNVKTELNLKISKITANCKF
jgi:transposase